MSTCACLKNKIPSDNTHLKQCSTIRLPILTTNRFKNSNVSVVKPLIHVSNKDETKEDINKTSNSNTFDVLKLIKPQCDPPYVVNVENDSNRNITGAKNIENSCLSLVNPDDDITRSIKPVTHSLPDDNALVTRDVLIRKGNDLSDTKKCLKISIENPDVVKYNSSLRSNTEDKEESITNHNALVSKCSPILIAAPDITYINELHTSPSPLSSPHMPTLSPNLYLPSPVTPVKDFVFRPSDKMHCSPLSLSNESPWTSYIDRHTQCSQTQNVDNKRFHKAKCSAFDLDSTKFNKPSVRKLCANWIHQKENSCQPSSPYRNTESKTWCQLREDITQYKTKQLRIPSSIIKLPPTVSTEFFESKQYTATPQIILSDCIFSSSAGTRRTRNRARTAGDMYKSMGISKQETHATWKQMQTAIAETNVVERDTASVINQSIKTHSLRSKERTCVTDKHDNKPNPPRLTKELLKLRNTTGYIADKITSKTDNLLSDPSKLSREERTLQVCNII